MNINRIIGRRTFVLIFVCTLLTIILLYPSTETSAQQATKEKAEIIRYTSKIFGSPEVQITKRNQKWTIAGKKQIATFKENDFAIGIETKTVEWKMIPSQFNDMIARTLGRDRNLRLADARKQKVEIYDTGYKCGIKITLEDWESLDLRVYLTICLEGEDEDLVFDIAADEKNSTIRELNWPTPLETIDIDYTVLSNVRGVLLPRNWPKPYHPVKTYEADGSISPNDQSEIQSNVIECWSMSWWGFQKKNSGMMVIVETPNDAAYQFNHPAGGPTIIGPQWKASLGRFGYPRTTRFCFFKNGNYVNMAKRYRSYVMDKGQFVSLKEKIERKPIVAQLIGTPIIRSGILTDYKEGSNRWHRDSLTRHSLTTFDQRAEEFRSLKEKGIEKLCVVLTGWPRLGYDRQHPDVLPPAPAAGGHEGMKRLTETCKELGYLFCLHDQYRDFYVDAPSFDRQFAIHEETAQGAPSIFPGTRFGDFKEESIPYMDYWDGGKMSYLNSHFMIGHLKKNYQWLFDLQIIPHGSYLDVFGYVPPDQDFNPEHPTTRTDGLAERINCYNWVRNNLGLVGTETACDWTIPYVDFSSPLSPTSGIEIPLWDLVYHDAILTPYSLDNLRGFLNGGLPQLWRSPKINEAFLDSLNRMRALNKRLAFSELINHEFLDSKFRIERTTFSEGSTVTVNWDTNNVEIKPELKY